MSPPELVRLAGQYRQKKDDSGLKNLASFIVGEYLPEPGLADAIYPLEWSALMRIVSESGDAGVKSKMLSIVGDRVEKQGGFAASLDRQGLLDFWRGLEALGGGPELRERLALAWLGLFDQNDQTDQKLKLPADLSKAAAEAVYGDEESFKAFDRREADRFASGSFTPAEYRATAALIGRLMRPERMGPQTRPAMAPLHAASEWADRIAKSISECKDAPSIEQLDFAARVLPANLKLPAERMQAFVEKLSQYRERSTEVPDSTYEALAWSLCGNEAWRKALESAMVSPEGRINLPVVKVLAWSHRHDKKIRPFAGQLQKLATEKKPQGDALAEWQLGLAYAASLTRETGVCRTDGSEQLRLAMGAASTEEMRIRCIQEMAAAARAANSYEHVTQVIESMKGQFVESAQQKLQALQAELAQEASQSKVELAEGKARRELTNPWIRLFADRRRELKTAASRPSRT